MAKNKVVIYNTRKGGAKIFVTDNPDDIGVFSDEVKLVNPDISYVADIPPEFWNLEDGRLMPITDEKALKERVESVSSRTLVNQFDADTKQKLSNLVEIPEVVGTLTDAMFHETSAIKDALSVLKKEMFDEIRDLNCHIESRYLSQITMHKTAIASAIDTLEKAIVKSFLWIIAFLLIILAINIWQVVVFIGK